MSQRSQKPNAPMMKSRTRGAMRRRSLRSGRQNVTVHRRSARVVVTVLLVVAALAAGAIGGYWLPSRISGLASATDSGVVADTAAKEGQVQWYSCGMHPNVLQKGPGDCPICHMKLTPRKPDTDERIKGHQKERKVLYWRAPMDPNYISDKPGKSPMGMDLVPVYADETASASAHTIRIDPVTIQNMGVRTEVLRRGPLVKTVRTVGRVDYDERRVTFVDTKFSGWIEHLYVDETGQFVEKGRPLFDVYSPELYAAQEEYLAAVRNLPLLKESKFMPAREDAAKLVKAAETKLSYYDVSDDQISRLRESQTVQKAVTIHSPARGIVTEKMALEGMYVKPSMRLYTIADLSRIWVYVDVYEYQLPWIRLGQTAYMTLPYTPGREFVGTVVYLYPYLDRQTRVIKIRLEFENPTLELKPGMFASIRLESELKRDALLIPRMAYIDSGIRKLVFVDRGGGKYEPREIQTGVEAENGLVEVLYGVDEGEVVVASGQFMLDAESKLKEAVAKMTEPQSTETTKRHAHRASDQLGHDSGVVGTSKTMPDDAAYACPMETHPDESDPSKRGPYFAAEPGSCPRCDMKLTPLDELPWAQKYVREAQVPAATDVTKAIPQNAKYACPMEAHPEQENPAEQGVYFSGDPGTCPWCGMKLKPLEDLQWVQVRRAAKGGDVAYTCPDHQHVFSETPGECPRCGRKLEPFKVMYTCPDPAHAGVISTFPSNCPHCGRGLAAFRGVWLTEKMADANVPPIPGLAEVAPYRCPTHSLVHSDEPGHCTICGRPLEATQKDRTRLTEKSIPQDAKYVCPMKKCWHFSAQPGECPLCGMRLKAIEDVAWASDLKRASRGPAGGKYVCPMHAEKVKGAVAGTCPICGMQLVHEAAFQQPKDAPARVAAQVNYITEHYLELHELLASDRTDGVARQVLAIASASDELMKHLADPAVSLPTDVHQAVRDLHAAALRISGTRLTEDRVAFVKLSDAMRILIENARPDRQRWPKLYIYHCPMSKGDWIQDVKDKRNPYYGFEMLTCGELKGVK